MIRPYLTLDEISFRMKESCSIDQFRRWQAIYLRLKMPSISVREVASICSASNVLMLWRCMCVQDDREF